MGHNLQFENHWVSSSWFAITPWQPRSCWCPDSSTLHSGVRLPPATTSWLSRFRALGNLPGLCLSPISLQNLLGTFCQFRVGFRLSAQLPGDGRHLTWTASFLSLVLPLSFWATWPFSLWVGQKQRKSAAQLRGQCPKLNWATPPPISESANWG